MGIINFYNVSKGSGSSGTKMKVISKVATSTEALEDNTYYNYTGTISNTEFVLPNIVSDGYIHNIIISFTADTNNSITFSAQANIKYFDGYTIEDDTTYEISCLFNGTNWIIAYAVIA